MLPFFIVFQLLSFLIVAYGLLKGYFIEKF